MWPPLTFSLAHRYAIPPLSSGVYFLLPDFGLVLVTWFDNIMQQKWCSASVSLGKSSDQVRSPAILRPPCYEKPKSCEDVLEVEWDANVANIEEWYAITWQLWDRFSKNCDPQSCLSMLLFKASQQKFVKSWLRLQCFAIRPSCLTCPYFIVSPALRVTSEKGVRTQSPLTFRPPLSDHHCSLDFSFRVPWE